MLKFLFLMMHFFPLEESSNTNFYLQPHSEEFLSLVILPEDPPADAFEKVKGLYVGWYEGDEVCILEFEPIELTEDHPLDHDGFPLVVDSDGMTLLPQQDIIDSVNQRTCNWK